METRYLSDEAGGVSSTLKSFCCLSVPKTDLRFYIDVIIEVRWIFKAITCQAGASLGLITHRTNSSFNKAFVCIFH